MSAAKFLKKSGLSDVVLSRIWDLSDPSGRGYLDKEGLFVSLKLVALAQAGHDINMRNIFIEPPNPPKVVSLQIKKFKITKKIKNNKKKMYNLNFRVKFQKLFHQKYKQLHQLKATGLLNHLIVLNTNNYLNHYNRSMVYYQVIK